MRVGIPRALFYYHYYPMWRTFFDVLDVECVVSSPTHKGILSEGASRVTAETCLPVKIYLGHVLALADKVDYMFTPLIRTLAPEEENCARLRGLPDLVRAVIPECPPMLSPEIDVQGGARKIASAVFDTGTRFTYNLILIKKAVDQSLAAQRAYEDLLISGTPAPLALAQFETGGEKFIGRPLRNVHAPVSDSGGLTAALRVAVLGHAYNLYDEYMNHRLLSRLRSLGVELVTPHAVSPDLAQRAFETLQWKKYWTYEHELAGAAAYYLAQGQLDGMITVITFGCGPDAVVIDSLNELSRRYRVPLLSLVLDEHAGEAGLITRIEAFVDMLQRKNRQEVS